MAKPLKLIKYIDQKRLKEKNAKLMELELPIDFLERANLNF